MRKTHKEQRAGWEVTLLITTNPVDPALITPLRLTLSKGNKEKAINAISQLVFNLFIISRLEVSKMSITVTPLMMNTVSINNSCMVFNNSFFMVIQLWFWGRLCV